MEKFEDWFEDFMIENLGGKVDIKTTAKLAWEAAQKEPDNYDRYPLFELMQQEHGKALLDTELDEIISVCKKITHKEPSGNEVLGQKHTGCRISAPGILGRIRDRWKIDQGQRYAAGELLKHMQLFAKRYYEGDIKAIDEFLQLYCLDEARLDN